MYKICNVCLKTVRETIPRRFTIRLNGRELPRAVCASEGFAVDVFAFVRFFLVSSDVDRLKPAEIADAMIFAVGDGASDRRIR